MVCFGSPPFLIKSLLSQSTSHSTFINWYRYVILLLTFLVYTCYHLSRKPISVVKSALNPSCGNNETDCGGWAPFDSPYGSEYLGALDSAFLFTYAAGMFISGHIAERMDLRLFLATGMVGTGVVTCLFGLGKSFNMHHVVYFGLVQAICGLFQSTGWPAVVTCVSNWFGKGKRGLIMGVWNSHTSVGNILGALVAGWFVDTDWSLSFIVPGVIIIIMTFPLWLFLVPCPKDLDKITPASDQLNEESNNLIINVDDNDEDDEDTDHTSDLRHLTTTTNTSSINNDEAISFSRALAIPGVVEFSLCLFFSKLVSYTFLFWLPFYIANSTSYDSSKSAELSTLFDLGGILGGIVAGVVSDISESRALTCSLMFLLAAPFMYLYYYFAGVSLTINICLLLVTGFLVNGPYALITTAVSADLGTHSSLRGNCKALSTVTSIIDGTGSLGAAMGPLLTSLITPYGWNRVFQMLIVSDVLALLVSTYVHFQVSPSSNTMPSPLPRAWWCRCKVSQWRLGLRQVVALLAGSSFFTVLYLTLFHRS